MIKTSIISLILSLFLFSSSFSAGSSSSSGGSSSNSNTMTDYDWAERKILKAKKLEKKNKIEKAKKNYKEALNYLQKANKNTPANPDVLNYLGFVNRKLGNFKDAEMYYLIGLEIEPSHTGINEYLGELYVATNRHNLAIERLEILKTCNCEEYDQLKAVIAGEKVSKY